jgi:hypothetical protein
MAWLDFMTFSIEMRSKLLIVVVLNNVIVESAPTHRPITDSDETT